MLFSKKPQEPKFQPQPIHTFKSSVGLQGKKDKSSEYNPVGGGLSYKELKLAAWYVSHKILLQKIGKGLLIFWCVFSLGYSGYHWAEYLIVGYAQDQMMLERQVAELPNYSAIQPRYAPHALQIGPAGLFGGANDKYDFVSEAKNPNERWIARVSYKYLYAGGETSETISVILPGAELPLVVLGHEARDYPVQVKLQIIKVDWDKVNPHEIADVKNYLAERLNFTVSPMRFTRADNSELATSRLEFAITNNSAYSYWQPQFFVLLLRGGEIAGAVSLTLEQFLSGEERMVDWRFLDNSLSVTDIKVFPAFNVFDPSIFMGPGKQ